jgi:hypothetical protein
VRLSDSIHNVPAGAQACHRGCPAARRADLPTHAFRRWSSIRWSMLKRWQPRSRHGPWPPNTWPGAPCMGRVLWQGFSRTCRRPQARTGWP